ncbi:hypothetical protein GGD88_001341 [Roseospira goensis]|uniref:Uncharacterized protein n=1 Tax=Roseospira goensis TaxID=391922 RepID=A0A7W6RYS1_9PROT|nr:hypothetical protein [Roseospira goensis]
MDTLTPSGYIILGAVLLSKILMALSSGGLPI